MNDTSLILLVWATALVFLFIRTKGFKNTRSTTVMIFTLFVVSILHRVYGDVSCLYIFAVVITGLQYLEDIKISGTNIKGKEHDE